ncbi:uncharacterized protein N7503_009793 [Penicillium pulvis]|uniref:uncharacterized protein n=1 Tax=Penicillium pulvis TaxID=1562058 RepID=UPI0025497F83|nr:uncharacterized protein N7503_009793 [Penicillium pulvis]KAJ5784581.1 hypothetical protein N7503_009793 [Penicillium pulvis]
MISGIHRKRLACVECTRRKVKCDKILPCRNCTKKGTACTRPRERSSPSHATQSERPILTRPTTDSEADVSVIIERLQSRVKELEAALNESNEASPRPRVVRPDPSVNSSSFSPAESAQSPFSVRNSNHVYVENTPREVEDAATILEFLAWGRRKDPTYQDEIARQNNIDHSPGDVPVEDVLEDAGMSGLSAAALCQALLPNKKKVYDLVRYHCDCLLWYHASFHAKTFLAELDLFYEKDEGQVKGGGLRLQWIALLFAILTGSMACAPRPISQSWGFRDREKDTLSKRWLKATIACLHEADYMACHSIYSVEAIATLTMSAHMLGHSNGFSVLLASAVRIAQGLGLHQLDESSDASPSGLMDREIGRRVWCQLCIQDWFSIPFTESYLIHKLGFSTTRPQNCDDDMNLLSNDHPSVISFSRLKYDIAALMPGLQDDLVCCNTLYTRYEEVLKYDRRLRTLATQHLPRYLQNVPIDPDWPCYVPWARKGLAISSAHKVIMIHRKFLSLSFSNPMFEFTRKTCVAASRTIIKEQKEATRGDGPVLWIHQAFSVTASIILCLDMFHQSVADRQSSEHRQLIEDGIEILSHCESDMIAQRGVSLLRSMLEAEQLRNRGRYLVPELREPSILSASPSQENGLDIADIIRAFYQHDRASLPGRPKSILQIPSTARAANHRHWSEITSVEPSVLSGIDMMAPLGVDYAEGLEDILNLATNYLN